VIPLLHRHLGTAPYSEVLELQRELRQQRIAGQIPDTVLTVEHPPTLTAGRRAAPDELLLPRSDLEARGVAVVEVERGGRWTFHGPGQLVAYPIVGLQERGLDVRSYVGGLEQALVALTRDVVEVSGARGVTVGRVCEHPGAWMFHEDQRVKIGSVGVHLRRFVAMHGLAWNLDPQPWGFSWIVPCGLVEDRVGSVRAVLARSGVTAHLPTVEASATRLVELLTACWQAERRLRGRSG
jgi:lipoate-protein ligase B